MDKQAKRIHKNQDKLNCFLDVGDLIEIHYSSDACTVDVYTGEIIDIGIRVQTGTDHDGLHPFITIGILPDEHTSKEYLHDAKYVDMGMFWIEDIQHINVLRLVE